ncbi:hypothetical protein CDAR_232461 [Caerostris darwini]|uniref:Uncharacterized protein n=1 Tax=Caerostris darwini TaxID=1538125 RepID=A0AAV4W5J1_9ARAC|nr:hypothetical protein CDAR_232461 [Caerostris darwini]
MPRQCAKPRAISAIPAATLIPKPEGGGRGVDIPSFVTLLGRVEHNMKRWREREFCDQLTLLQDLGKCLSISSPGELMGRLYRSLLPGTRKEPCSSVKGPTKQQVVGISVMNSPECGLNSVIDSANGGL